VPVLAFVLALADPAFADPEFEDPDDALRDPTSAELLLIG
jgi:hypothetical protein